MNQTTLTRSPQPTRAPTICPETAKCFAEYPEQTHPAVLFRRGLYIAGPFHQDAINLAFAGMTDLQKQHVSIRIGDGKESMLFGCARADGSNWEWDEVRQGVRLTMYGFK